MYRRNDRNSYCRNEIADFHRVVIVIENCELACFQYYFDFDDQELEVKSTVTKATYLHKKVSTWKFALFKKQNHELYIAKRNELDWWPKTNKANSTKQWCQSPRNHYYCLKLECLQKRRTLLSLANDSIYSQEDSASDKNLVNECFEIWGKPFASLCCITTN